VNPLPSEGNRTSPAPSMTAVRRANTQGNGRTVQTSWPYKRDVARVHVMTAGTIGVSGQTGRTIRTPWPYERESPSEGNEALSKGNARAPGCSMEPWRPEGQRQASAGAHGRHPRATPRRTATPCSPFGTTSMRSPQQPGARSTRGVRHRTHPGVPQGNRKHTQDPWSCCPGLIAIRAEGSTGRTAKDARAVVGALSRDKPLKLTCACTGAYRP
jgi:hypothetical protein